MFIYFIGGTGGRTQDLGHAEQSYPPPQVEIKLHFHFFKFSPIISHISLYNVFYLSIYLSIYLFI